MLYESLITVLSAGASIVGSEFVKSATKDAYTKLKSELSRFLPTSTLEAVIEQPSDSKQREAIRNSISRLSSIDAENISRLLIEATKELRAEPKWNNEIQVNLEEIDVGDFRLTQDGGGKIDASIRKAKTAGSFIIEQKKT